MDLLRLRQTSWLIEFHSQELRLACMDLLLVADYEVDTIRHPHYPDDLGPDSMWWNHGWLRAAPRG
jgi:hypothetical protein